MNIAFLDLANKTQVFAHVTESAVSSAVFVDDHKDEAALTDALQEIMQKANLTLEDLTHIACVLGPGGFTTLRVGVAMANALSYALHIPSCGIHASDIWKQRVGNRDCVWLHSTRKTQLFVRGFGAFEDTWPEPILFSLDEFKTTIARIRESLLWEGVPFVGDLIPEHVVGLEAMSIEHDIAPLEQVLPPFLASLDYQNQTLLPWYGRNA